MYLKTSEESFEETRIIDPEIQQMAEQIASDPLLFKNRIEMVNKLGVIGRKEKHRDIHGCDRQFAPSNGDIWFRGACCKKLRSSRVREIASVVYDIETLSKERLLFDYKREQQESV